VRAPVPRPRLIAVDVDGTLMRSDNTLSPANRRAVLEARARGWHVVLATGKPPWAIAELAAALGLPGPHVVANGAALWTPTGGTEVLEEIARADAERALASAAARGAPRALSGPRGVFCQPDWQPEAVAQALRDVGEEPPTVVPDAFAAEPQLWKVITISPAAQGTPPAPELATGRWVRTHALFYEVVPARASKGAALARVAARLGVPQEGVVALGDSDNDIEMLRWAHLGFAMAHAAPHVKAAADRVAPDNDEDGVAQVVEALLRGEASP
jgi:Cof subfamily protein (haloacid dehalogenase superfamily)